MKKELTNTHIPFFRIGMKRPQPLRGEFKTLLVPWTEPSSAAIMAGSYCTCSRCKPSLPFSGYSFKRPLLASFSISTTTSSIVGLFSGALCAHSAATYQDSSLSLSTLRGSRRHRCLPGHMCELHSSKTVFLHCGSHVSCTVQ